MASVYEIITDRIVAQLESGVVPWHRPWANAEPPMNLASGKPYRGINVFLLMSAGYASPYWLTYKQAQERGGNVKKGEKGCPVIFWSFPSEQDKERLAREGKHAAPIVRYYTVFNVTQCENIAAPSVTDDRTQLERIAAAETLVASVPNAPAYVDADAAWYRPSTDELGMPLFERFESAERYYATLFHELTHSTGHEKRLGRDAVKGEAHMFGSPTYAQEELVAEMGAAMLCGVTGIENATIDQSASYIAGWLKALKNDQRMVIFAAAQAQKAADYLRGLVPAQASEQE